jgi:adenylylsulfate kinase
MPESASGDPEGFVLWIEGRPGTGKSTLAHEVAVQLKALGWSTEIVDGLRILRPIVRSVTPPVRGWGRELSVLLVWSTYALVWNELRHRVSPELRFSRKDKEFQARRVSYIARMLARKGVAVVVAMITPYETSRRAIRSVVGKRFAEVLVTSPVEVLQQRDPKGVYARPPAGAAEKKRSIYAPFEEPLHPDLVVDTAGAPVQESARRVMDHLRAVGLVSGPSTAP